MSQIIYYTCELFIREAPKTPQQSKLEWKHNYRMDSYFSCEHKTSKESVALQILGYSVLSILGERLEKEPRVSMKEFQNKSEPLQEIIDSVDICQQLWEAAKESKDEAKVFENLLAMEETISDEKVFETLQEKILANLREAKEPFNIIDELLDEVGITSERLLEVEKLLLDLSEKKQEEEPKQEQTQEPKPRTSRSKTLRVTGRRALTPIRHRRKKNIVPL